METEAPLKGHKKDAWIETFTGIKFNVFRPRQKDVDILDIAHALSMCTRFNGHLHEYYSVAEHCVIMSYLVAPEHALAALLHDAAEAYLSDVPRPIKYMLPDITTLDHEVSDCIFRKFGITNIDESIHEMDRRLCYTEAMKSGMQVQEWSEPYEPIDVMIHNWDWMTAKKRFINRFRELYYG